MLQFRLKIALIFAANTVTFRHYLRLELPTTGHTPHITVLGSRVSVIASYAESYTLIRAAARRTDGPAYITVNNAHTLVESVRRPGYRQIIEESLLSLADGRPLSLIGWFKGARHMHRIFGPTLMEKVLEWGQDDQLRHFFFGNTPDTLAKMQAVIRQRYPRAIICGILSPPFRPFTPEENDHFLDEIRRSNADIIWVSLGAPRQEEWIWHHFQRLDRGLCIGIGAGFSYLAGTIKHAPEWMKQMALEWFYRLMQEPLRLWRRYLISNSLFTWYLVREILTGHPRGTPEKLGQR